MNLASFVAAHNGQYVTAPGGLGKECVDLANTWLVANNAPEVHANAVAWQNATIPNWKWVANGPINFPPPGALVVWRQYAGLTGEYGHIAVIVAADSNNLVSYDQNWNSQPCQLVVHSYDGVSGWWQPA